jgi:sugar lactone lactonase YvrE
MNVSRFTCLMVLACAGTCVSSYALLTEPVGTSSATQTATVTITAAGTLESISVLTQGAIGLDFNPASGGTCSVGHAYAVGNTCTVNYTFKPTRPWIRYGGAALFDSAGNLLGNTYLTGTGTGPQVIFPSKSVTSLVNFGGDFSSPLRVAVDGRGDAYFTESGVGIVFEMAAVNGKIPANPTIKNLASGFSSPPYGLAVDGVGNVYVADGNSLKEIAAVNGSIPANPAIKIVGGGFNEPLGVAVDGSGNVYVTEFYNSAISEVVAVNGTIPANPTIRNLGSGFSSPHGVAVDGSGNVYVADFYNGQIKEIVAVDGCIPANPTINILGSGFSYPFDVAVDGSGNVYVADSYNSAIKEMVAVNGSIPANPTIQILGSGFNLPEGVAVDGSGNVYVADTFNSRVAKLNLADPPSLTFAITNVGSTSSPLSVTLANNGSATLTGSSLSVTANWDQVAGSGAPPDCTASFSLVPGAECNLSLTFEPTETGTVTGTATFTDNALNLAAATQEVSLSGAGTRLQFFLSATSLAFGSLALGQQKDMPLQATNSGTTPVTFAPTINGPSFTVPPSENGCGTVIPASHTCSFAVRFLPRTHGGHVDTLTLSGVPAPTVRLTGQTTGVGATTGVLVFGTIPYGTTAILPLTVENYGVFFSTRLSTSINGPSFKVLTAGNTCLAGITAGQQCTILVEFSPASVGGHGDVLTITAASGDVSVVKLYGIASQP